MRTSIKKRHSWSLLIAGCSQPPNLTGGGRAPSPSFCQPIQTEKNSMISPDEFIGSLRETSDTLSIFKKKRKNRNINSLRQTIPINFPPVDFPEKAVNKKVNILSPKLPGKGRLKTIRWRSLSPPGDFQSEGVTMHTKENQPFRSLSPPGFSRSLEAKEKPWHTGQKTSQSHDPNINLTADRYLVCFRSIFHGSALKILSPEGIKDFCSPNIRSTPNTTHGNTLNNLTDLPLSYKLSDTQRDNRDRFLFKSTITHIESSPLVKQIPTNGPPGQQFSRAIDVGLCENNSRLGPEFKKKLKIT